MAEQDYFKQALSNMTHEMASGGAIRHMTDLGYTVKEIAKRLTFPTPLERIQRTVWERLVDTGVILLEEPGSRRREKISYVKDYDPYGKASFRRVAETVAEKTAAAWREIRPELAGEGRDGRADFGVLLREKCTQNGEASAYVSCDFGLLRYENEARLTELLEALEEGDREYILGLPWERRVVYHRLNPRMRRILYCLCAQGAWHGTAHFTALQEKVYF